MEEILAQAKKLSEQAELFETCSKTTRVHFEANRLKQIQGKESTNIALRLIRDGKIGFAQANGIIDTGKLVKMAADTSQFGTPAKFDFPNFKSYPDVDTFDPQIDFVSVEEMVQLGEQLISAITEHTSDILCQATITKGVTSVRLTNSKGGEAGYSKSMFNIRLEGVLVRNEDILFVGDSQGSCHPMLDFKPIAEEVTNQLELAKRNVSISTGSMPVIFTPRGAASSLIAPLVFAFNGKIVLNGASPLKDKLGQQVFDRKFSLWDDATIHYQIASYPCDDEGVPGQKTPLVDHGVVSHFLYDLHTAALVNAQSTGNGNRHGGLPTPSPSSLVIDKGDVPFHNMVKDIREGLIIELLMGAEQGNILNGDFSGNILLGFKIENGEIIGRVKDTMVSGNVYQVLREIEAVGDEERWVEGTVLVPHIYCPKLSVATKTM